MYKSKVNIMANKDLFKQAIADAKSIREAAIANAKLALEESLTPQLKELLAQRLSEMEEEDAPATVISEEEVAEEVQEETLEEAIGSDGLQAVAEAEEEHSEEGEVEGDEAGEEAEVDSEESEDEAEEEVGEMSVDDLKDLIRDVLMQVMGDQEQAQEDELEADAEDMGAEDMTAVTDTEINIDELMAELATLNSPEGPTAHGNILEMEEVADPLEEAAVNELTGHLSADVRETVSAFANRKGTTLQEVMKKMAKYGSARDMKEVAKLIEAAHKLGEAACNEVMERLITTPMTTPPAMEEGQIGEVMVSGAIAMVSALTFILTMLGKAANADAAEAMAKELAKKAEAGQELTPEEQAIVDKATAIKAPGFLGKLASGLGKVADTMGTNKQTVRGNFEEGSHDLSEALSTIETLRNDLNETNLLNAKLLYVNKVFKASNLSESQKASVIAAFDKAETVKEVKLVYETVSENVSSVGKKEVVREAKGFASAAAGISTKPGVITETNQAVLRMQKLAGIIK